MNEKKKIIVTGGAGYIGSHTVVALIEKGYEPIILDDFRNAQASVIPNLEKITGQKLNVHSIDCCDRSAVETVFKNEKIEGIIHFAAYKAVGESVENPLMYYHNNLQSLVVMLEMVKAYQIETFVFSSSCTVYGEPKGTIAVDESFPIAKAFSPYGQTKIICEQIIEDFYKSYNSAKIICLRYFNPVGAHESALIGEYPIGKPNNLLPFITQTAIGKRESLTIFGDDYDTPDGTCIRDYIHVCDLADAHVRSIAYLESRTEGILDAINVGTGKGTSVKEMVDAFQEVTGLAFAYNIGPRRSGDVPAIYANTGKMEKVLNFKTQRSVADAVQSAWAWEKNIHENEHAR